MIKFHHHLLLQNLKMNSLIMIKMKFYMDSLYGIKILRLISNFKGLLYLIVYFLRISIKN